MNFLDAYDLTSTPTVPPSAEEPTQSLNEEVNQVVGQLSRFWGGFRKQSQTVFEAAKKDLGEAYAQAQKEITRLTYEPEATSPTTAPADTATISTKDTEDAEDEEDAEDDSDDNEEEDSSYKPKAAESEPTIASTASTSTFGHARTASQNFFQRLQTSLPANLVASVQNVQNQLPDALKQPSSVDFAQLRTTLTSEFQRVQGITRAQAEEYVHKSEGLLKEAQEFLKEAVKVVPPEEADRRGGSVAPAGMLWDGSDLWMIPDVAGPSLKGKEKEGEPSVKSAAEGLRAVATRAESLLKQLRHNPEVIKVDPTADESAKALYEQWTRDHVDSEEGGITGKHWSEATQKALADPADGSALQDTHDALVPEHITSETFWTRYFFRVHQVEQDEQRRKALIQGTMTEDEDFSWEDDDDETTSPTTAKPPSSSDDTGHSLRASIDTLQAPPPHARQSSEHSSPRTSEAESSRRQSSEASYDVVSSQVSTSGDPPVEKKKTQDDDEEDEEEEDEEDEDDEEEEESDWE